ncbi:ParB N-terminal domain-containing protein [Pannonibacter indicus]|uniref:ParB N-terminal domain-containing protein n=1 Tax=Pannonibacter indicus TaxID=466044 RepID=UPI00391B88A8
MTTAPTPSVAQSILIPVADIHIGERLRTVDADYVAMLAASIGDIGLMHPIEVGAADRRGRYPLIAGAHRLAAYRELNLNEVPALVVSVKGIDAQLREIDENLMRRELSALDRAVFLARRKEIWEAKNPAARHGGDRRSDQVANVGDLKSGDLIGRFTADVAEKLELSERSVQRAIARYTRIAPDVRARIATTWIARRGSMLDKLAKESPEHQRAMVAELLGENRPAKTVAQARAAVRGPSLEEVINQDERQFQVLMRAWRTAGQRVRDRFIAHLNSIEAGTDAAADAAATSVEEAA